jgi:RNA polymerase sigma-70 factor (family 1)
MALYSKHTDEQLLQFMKGGEESAFTELYNRYWERLLVRAILQLGSREEAEELLHDVFVGLWKRRETIELRHGFHTYIAAVLKYEIFGRLADRRNKRAKHAAAERHAQLGQHGSLLDHSTEERLDFLDLQERLEATVRQLPDKCQLVFRLSREKGLPEKEIAEKLGVSRKTVQNHIHRALQTLKSILKNPHLFLF